MTPRLRGWIAAVFAVLSSWQGRASACSVILPEKQSLSCGVPGADAGVQHTSVAGATLELEAAQVQRSRYAPPGLGDCGELGNLRLRFRLAGSSAWPSDVGLLLTLREGEFGYFQPPLTQLPDASGWLLLPEAGEVRFLGPDDPWRPLQLLLEARAVDCSNAVSAALEVRVRDPGRAPDAGSSSAPLSPSATAGSTPTAGSTATQPTDAPAPRTTPSRAACAFNRLPAAALPGGFALGGSWLAAAALVLRRRRR